MESPIAVFRHNPINEPKFEITQDNETNPKQKYRWNIKVSGRIVAASSEGYESRQHCIDNVKNIRKHIESLEKKNLIK